MKARAVLPALAAVVALAAARGESPDGSAAGLAFGQDFGLVAGSSAEPEDGAQGDPLNAVVKLEVQTAKPDFIRPWRTNLGSGDGSGVVVSDGLVLTCAHCVADGTYIRVRKNNEDALYHGRVEVIDNGCDLALVRVDDPAFMKDVSPMEIGETPPVRSEVVAVGYPIGGNGVSFTRGIVSRIEDIRYEQDCQTLLAAQVDAAINPGNSGGPVLDMQTGLVGGISFQGDSRGEALGYMIPAEIVRRFLRDAADGRIDGVPDATWTYGRLESAAARRFLGMSGDQTGVLVEDVRGGSGKSSLRVGDVVLSVGGYNMANNGNIRVEGNEIRSAMYPFYMRQIGETVPATILRDGAVSELMLPVRQLNPKGRLFMYDRAPDYFLFGAFVFTTASLNYMLAARPEFHDQIYEEKEFDGEEPVVISAVMPDVCADGYLGVSGSLVRSVNGEKIRNLRHLVETLDGFDGEFLVFGLDRGDEWDSKMILDASEMREATPRVMGRFAIPSDRSADLAAPPAS